MDRPITPPPTTTASSRSESGISPWYGPIVARLDGPPCTMFGPQMGQRRPERRRSQLPQWSDLMTTVPGTFADPTFGTPGALRGEPRRPPAASRAPTDGLYDPRFEHDACGIALVADLHGRPSHGLVRRGITALEHLAHRGATGSEEDSGDGAGILLQIPHRFYREVVGFDLPEAGHYATGIAFLSRDPSEAAKARTGIEQLAEEEGLDVLGWRDVPFD